MASLNLVQLIGNLGADPEVRSTQGGKKVVNMRLACSESWKDRDGNRQERTEWIQVTIFNEGIAGVAEKYLRKGSKCYVSGKFQTRKWQDQSGQDRYSTEVVVQPFSGELILLDPPRAQGEGRGFANDGRQQSGGGTHRQPAPAYGDDDLDQVPF